MKRRVKLVIVLVLIIVIFFVGKNLLFPGDWNQESCNKECLHRGFEIGICKWEIEMMAGDVGIGKCLVEDSRSCNEEGWCDCYCADKSLFGGCDSVALENQAECCDKWAMGKAIVLPNCVGKWKVIGGRCSWVCDKGE